MYVVFDIETNGLLDTLDTVHCISISEIAHDGSPRGVIFTCNDHGGGRYQHALAEGLDILQNADCVIGHNIAAFDLPALAKVYPGFKVKTFRDTLLISTLAFPDVEALDYAGHWKREVPDRVKGRHSLEAWGYRLGCWKGDYVQDCKVKRIDPWREWNEDMDEYCRQDALVTTQLYRRLLREPLVPESIRLEHELAPILARQHARGFLFDLDKALELEQHLVSRRAALHDELAMRIEPWQKVKRTFVPKRNDQKRGYQKGVEITVYEEVTFNPASRDHIADRLTALYGWTPKEFTPSGKPKIDEDVLSGLRYPVVPCLREYFEVNKRLGQLSEGREAWLNAVAEDGRIHGSIQQNAAVTGRMTHSKPNMAQVPRVGNPYGAECRELFCVPEGHVLVGVDASGLELRCLAHYMALFDKGAYARVILDGDIHSVNQAAAGLPTRDNAKTFIYAFLYGAGDEKLGAIIGKGRQAGAKLRKQFLKELPALERLVTGVKAKARERGWLRGLDGRRLHIRSEHAALNTLLQSAGALVMKQALVIADRDLRTEYGNPGIAYEFVANVHDEFQIEVAGAHPEMVGEICTRAIRLSGEHFKFRCPLAGEYKIGRNWSETH